MQLIGFNVLLDEDCIEYLFNDGNSTETYKFKAYRGDGDISKIEEYKKDVNFYEDVKSGRKFGQPI